MGTQLKQILIKKEITLEDLANKKLVVDSFNMLYQFLTTIRQKDGTPLKDSKGNITSHLSGLFFRTIKLMKQKIKLAFVFDGNPPEEKKQEKERRKELKQEAMKKYEQALKEQDIELMKKYASRTSVLTDEMINEAKELIKALGLPVIQAPSEGEAQAAYMCKKREFYALISQDTDGLLFGSPRIIRNLSITGRKKKTNTLAYETIMPEIIDLEQNLQNLGITQDQLIIIALLVGTDFNVNGIKGIGPKKALKLVKAYGNNFDKIFKEANWNKYFSFSWKKIFNLIKNIPVTDNYELSWQSIDKNKIYELLVDKHDFSKERIENALSDLIKETSQKGLTDFF